MINIFRYKRFQIKIFDKNDFWYKLIFDKEKIMIFEEYKIFTKMFVSLMKHCSFDKRIKDKKRVLDKKF